MDNKIKKMGGEAIDNETFLQRLKQLYSSAKAWGTVRVTIKRLFVENFKHKKSMRKQRNEDKLNQCQDPAKEFKLVIKAAIPQKHFSTVVMPNEISTFEPKLTQLMTQAIFKEVLEKQDKMKKKKGGKAAKETTAPKDKKAAKVSKRELQSKIKKNRKERRKEIMKA